jgi:hypothetical protein
MLKLVLESSRVEPRNWREQNFQVSKGGTVVELNALETRDAADFSFATRVVMLQLVLESSRVQS